MWHDGRIYFTEMGADRVSVIENGKTREFWHLPGCGPTQIVPFGPTGFVVDCHLGRGMVEVSATGVTGRKFPTNRDGQPLQDPNAAVSDGAGGAYFSDAGIFDLNAPPTGRVYHLTAMGVMTEVVVRHPLRQRRQLRSGQPHALRLRASGAARAGDDARRQRACHRAEGADRFRADRRQQVTTAIRWRGPTASRCGRA